MTDFETAVVDWMAAIDQRIGRLETQIELVRAAVVADRAVAAATKSAHLTPVPRPLHESEW